jgi:hypothetical protein
VKKVECRLPPAAPKAGASSSASGIAGAAGGLKKVDPASNESSRNNF